MFFVKDSSKGEHCSNECHFFSWDDSFGSFRSPVEGRTSSSGKWMTLSLTHYSERATIFFALQRKGGKMKRLVSLLLYGISLELKPLASLIFTTIEIIGLFFDGPKHWTGIQGFLRTHWSAWQTPSIVRRKQQVLQVDSVVLDLFVETNFY